MAKMKMWLRWSIALVTVLVTAWFFLSVDLGPKVEYVAEPEPTLEVDSVPLPPSEYGIPMEGFVLETGRVKNGATFGNMLAAHGISMETVHLLAEKAQESFDVRRMRSGNPFAFIFSDDH